MVGPSFSHAKIIYVNLETLEENFAIFCCGLNPENFVGSVFGSN